MVEQSLKTGKI